MTTISYVRPQHDRTREAMTLAAANVADANPYNLTMRNRSGSAWNFYVYQQMPNQESANVFSLAWFCSPFKIVSGNQISFQWTIDYTFVWGAVGTIQPGVTFSAAGQQQANLVSANTTKFDVSPGPFLSTPVAGPPQGSLVINNTAAVPNNTFSVGIGMGDAGTFVTAAGANLKSTFTPTPTYWIAAGTNVQVGTILDITTVTQNAQVIFPVNVYSADYTLSTLNTWAST
jgi:rhizosphere induced protein